MTADRRDIRWENGPCGSADCCERCGEPQGSEGSEPPIDWEAWVKIADWHIKERPQHAMTGLCRAFKALKAERDALPADWRKDSSLATWFPLTAKELADLKADNAALKARVEELEGAIVDATQRANYSAWIVLDDMANAIRARKEASNGK